MSTRTPHDRPPAGFSWTASRRLGHGASGEVWLADHPRFGRIAVKLVAPELGPAAHTALREEHRRLTAIRHPHLVQALALEESAPDPGSTGATPRPTLALLLELVEGRPFLDALGGDSKTGPQERARRDLLLQMVALAVQLLDALAAIHEHGLVHRDIKPANVLVSETGSVKLLDLGLAGTTAAGPPAAAGTLRYMAPELLAGAGATPAADIYSVGVILFEALTGEVPFGDAGDAAIFSRRRLNEPAPSARERNPAVPEPLAALIGRMLERDPKLRPASAIETARLLTAAVHGTVGDDTGAGANGVVLSALFVRAAGISMHPRELARMNELTGRALSARRRLSMTVTGPAEAGLAHLGENWLAGLPPGVLGLRLDCRGESRPFAAFEPLVEEAAIELSTVEAMELMTMLPHGRALLAVSAGCQQIPGFDLLPRLGELPPEQDLARTGIALATLARALASRRPLALLITADATCTAATRGALDRLRSIDDATLLMTCIDPAAQTAAGDETVFVIDRMNPAGLASLTSAALGAAASGALLAWLEEVSDGLLDRALDALRMAASIGALRMSNGLIELAPDARSRLAAGTWQADWLARLPEPTRRAAQALALTATAPLSSELAMICDIDEVSAKRAIDSLIQAGIVTVERGRLRFLADSIRDAASASLDESARFEIHRSVARAAEQLRDAVAAAHHWLLASEPGRARPHLLAAARESQRRLASTDLLRFAQAGLADDGISGDERLAFSAMRARSLAVTGPANEALAACTEIRARLSEPDPTRSSESERDGLEALFQAALQQEPDDSTRSLFQAFLERAQVSSNRPAQGYAQMRIGCLLSRSVPAEAESYLRRAMSLFLELRDHASLTLTLANLSIPIILLGRTEDAMRVLTRTRRLASLLGIPLLQFQSDLNRSALLQIQCRYAEALRVARTALSEARRLGEEASALSLQFNIATNLYHLGHYAEAGLTARETSARFRARGMERRSLAADVFLLAIRIRCGDHREAVIDTDTATAAVASKAREYLPRRLFLLAEARQQADDFAGAEHDIAGAEAVGKELGFDWTAAEAAWLRARAALREGRPADAALLVPSAAEDARRRHDLPLESQLLAVLALATADVAVADRSLQLACDSGDPEVELAARTALTEILRRTGAMEREKRERAAARELIERTALRCGDLRDTFLRRREVLAILAP